MKNVEQIYALSPMQQGMLFHTLYEPASGVYVQQVSCSLHGDLDAGAFRRAWQTVIERHAILRTAFLWEGLEEAVQAVRQRVRLPWQEEDWRQRAPAEQQAGLRALLEEDRRQSFKLSAAPLMRLYLIRLAEHTYHFTWSYHHLLLDGWSVPIIQNEVFAYYAAFAQGRSIELARPRPYRDYIAWLREQDAGRAEAFWRQRLEGFAALTPLAVDSLGEPGAATSAGEREALLAEASSAALYALSRQHGLTINTLVQGAWALLLSRYSGEPDVVFGAVVAGRPPDLAGSDSIVGLFINTLPVRVRVASGAPALDWLRQLQTDQAELHQYEYSSLSEIQGWSAVPRGTPLFESIVVFENYPVAASVADQDGRGQLAIRNLRTREQSNYPLTVVAGSDTPLSLLISYDGQRFDAATIARMLGHLRAVLAGIASGPAARLAALPLLTRAERQQLLAEWNDTTPGVRSQESGVRSQECGRRCRLSARVDRQAGHAHARRDRARLRRDEQRTTNEQGSGIGGQGSGWCNVRP